jgi:hypothetical protein
VPYIELAQCRTMSPIKAATLGAVQFAVVELFTWARLAVTNKLPLPRKVEIPPQTSSEALRDHVYEAGSEAPANLL